MNHRQTITTILRESAVRQLPMGFAARVAHAAMSQPAVRGIWEYLLELTPRTGLAISAIATILVVMGISGGGPGLVQSITDFVALSNPLPLP